MYFLREKKSDFHLQWIPVSNGKQRTPSCYMLRSSREIKVCMPVFVLYVSVLLVFHMYPKMKTHDNNNKMYIPSRCRQSILLQFSNATGVHRPFFLLYAQSSTIQDSLYRSPQLLFLQSSLQVLFIQGSPLFLLKKPFLNTRGGSTTRPSSLLIDRPQKSPSSSLVLYTNTHLGRLDHGRRNFLSNIRIHLSITSPVFYNPILSTPTEATRFFSDRLRLLSMGYRLSFTIMAATLGVGAPPGSNNKQWTHGHVHLSFKTWLKP
ncbi:hypothetical protein TNCV_2989111 [Trichonephila clavipes]|nr:hypothetical protein TNCV_2989111 [Trichonephila clavipes]